MLDYLRVRVLLRALSCIAIAAIALPAPDARSQDLEVIELRYRLAEEILPALQPLLEPGAALSGSGDVIFVRTSPANFDAIRRAVAALDRAPRQLLITVRQATAAGENRGDVRGSATVAGADAQVDINRPRGPETGVEVQASGGIRNTTLSNVSSVRVLEGRETYVAVSQSVPISTVSSVPGWGTSRTVTFRDVSTGFYATARLSGDIVQLEISPQQQPYQPSRGQIETRHVTSTVSGRLGEWLQIGAVGASDSGSTRGLLVWGRHDASSQYAAWVKVEEVR